MCWPEPEMDDAIRSLCTEFIVLPAYLLTKISCQSISIEAAVNQNRV